MQEINLIYKAKLHNIIECISKIFNCNWLKQFQQVYKKLSMKDSIIQIYKGCPRKMQTLKIFHTFNIFCLLLLNDNSFIVTKINNVIYLKMPFEICQKLAICTPNFFHFWEGHYVPGFALYCITPWPILYLNKNYIIKSVMVWGRYPYRFIKNCFKNNIFMML